MKRKKRIIKLLVILVVGLSLSAQAQGDLLFDGGAPDSRHGLRISDIGFVVSAADFQTTDEWHIASAEFWSHEIPNWFEWDGTVSYFVFEDDAGMPSGSPIYSGQAQSVVKTLDPDVNTTYSGFKYSFNFEVPLELEADTIYWLALNLGGGGTMNTTQAFWAGTTSGFLIDAIISHNLLNWAEYYFDLAFRLYSSVPVAVDIKPGSCPNTINIDSSGILTVAILGTEDLDETAVDPASIRLEGIAPIRSSIKDVAGPIIDREYVCDCTKDRRDGFDDLVLKFRISEVFETLGEIQDGDILKLKLTGVLTDGTPIRGMDCTVIVNK